MAKNTEHEYLPTPIESATPSRLSRLTKREVEILTLSAQGIPPREIAATLFVSKRTIDFHRNNIFIKLEVHTIIQAINIARERGLIPLTGGHHAKA